MKVELNELNEEVSVDEPILVLAKNNHWFIDGLGQASRYFGYWLKTETEIFRLIDSIVLAEPVRAVRIEGPNQATLFCQSFVLKIKLDDQGLELNFSKNSAVEIYLDLRKIYSNIIVGNVYFFLPIANGYQISFDQKEENWNLDLTVSYQGQLKLINQWLEKKYDFDLKRQSQPAVHYVLFAFKGNVDYLKIFSANKKVLDSIDFFPVRPTLAKVDRQIDFLFKRLSALFQKNHFIAGLPWFGQVWQRDELISLWATSDLIEPNKILSDSISRIETGWDKNQLDASLAAADTFLLLILVSSAELILANGDVFKKYFRLWLDRFFINGSIRLAAKETWMDSLDRPAAIEIDALFLNALTKINVCLADSNLEKIRKFYQRRIKTNLITRTYDQIELERPNFFWAYLIYPALLRKTHWEEIFDQLIETNFSDWGGLTSLNKNSSFYQAYSSGENPASYHRGDSWFWLNNLAALALFKLNRLKYKIYIDKIFEASLKDLANYGLGWSSEIAEAATGRSTGSPVQLWSIATLIKLLRETKNN